MKIVACYSNKGGVGKTAAAVNLAYAFAAAGQRTLICDLDPQGASSFYFRVRPSEKLKDETFFKDVEKFAGAIRASDYENLDVLPANLTYRDFDVFLSRMKNSRSRLKKALKTVKADYDVILLDCPPNISMLSENVFRSADIVLVPVIPTTLSQRSLEQLVAFFDDRKLPLGRLAAFFSMVQGAKKLHGETIAELTRKHEALMLPVHIPFATDIERMGVHREPVMATAPGSAAAQAYHALFEATLARLAGI